MKIQLVETFLEASLILIKLDNVQVRREPSDTRSKMTLSAVYELSLCFSQIKAL